MTKTPSPLVARIATILLAVVGVLSALAGLAVMLGDRAPLVARVSALPLVYLGAMALWACACLSDEPKPAELPRARVVR